MDLKFSLPLIFWFILRMIQEKHWEYNAMATESLESMACNREKVCWSWLLCVWGRWRINVCIPDLLYSERGAYFLPSEDYGTLSQDLRQLEGVQTQQLAGVSDHWKSDKDAENTFVFWFHISRLTLRVSRPCLVVICAPPAVMNSMFPNWRTPDRSLNMSLISSSVNWSTFRASCSGKSAAWEIRHERM